MRKPILMALALVLGTVFWLQQGEGEGDDSGVELAERPASARPTREPSGAAAAASASAATTTNDAGAWFVQGVQAWEARVRQNEALPASRAMTSAAPSAWAAVQPSPPPPPPRAARQAEASPLAPPFPHHWVGRFDDEASPGHKPVRRAVISGPVSTWVAREGDVIEGQWRIDQIQDRLIRLTYLPLQQSQTVAMK
jgi:hypothetical protein